MITEDCLMQTTINPVDVVTIPDKIPAFVVEDYDFMDEKDMNKFIQDLERFVRSSYEYRNMVQYLREYVNMKNCAFMPKITNENTFKIKIEIHHSPFTLRDICATIFNKRQKNNENLNIEAVAYEVMYVHYCLMIGLIPLSETVHELVHTQYIFVPVDKVYGYYQQFVKTYYDYIDPQLLDRLDELQKLTIEGSYNDMYKTVLEKKYISVDMGMNDQFKELHEMQEILKDRLTEIKEGEISIANSNMMHIDNL